MTKKIRIDEIELEGCQSRAGTCEATVAEYAELWVAGAEFPPVVLFSDGSKYYCGDGHHRILGADKALIETIEAHVSKGGKSDALWYSTSANAIHGKRRTNADKRNAVKIALKLKPDMSDRAVADHCGVGHPLVAEVRRQVEESSTSKPTAKRAGRDGKSYPAASAKKSNPEPATKPLKEESTPASQPDDGTADLAKKNKALAHAHRDKLARAICDYHELNPNRNERDRLVKLVQGVELW